MHKINIILASSSPRRISMFRDNGFDPIIMPPNVDETIPDFLTMEQSVMYLAIKKGLSVEAELLRDSASYEYPSYIVAADTIVYKNKIIGKPADDQDAFNILKYLRNSSHYVVSGVSIIEVGTPSRKVFYDITEVFFGDYSDDDIRYYIENDHVLDKAGSYAIQSNIWKRNIIKINGDYDNIVGFPWEKFMRELKELTKA